MDRFPKEQHVYGSPLPGNRLHSFANGRIGNSSMLDQFAILIAIIIYTINIGCIFIELVKAHSKLTYWSISRQAAMPIARPQY
jgi:hypothetical protein